MTKSTIFDNCNSAGLFVDLGKTCCMRPNVSPLFFLVLLFLLIDATAQTNNTSNGKYFRQYQPGETSRYQLTTEVVHNGKWQSTIKAICELKVVTDSGGIPYEEVRWLRKTVITAKDTTEHTAAVQAVTPYRFSLHPSGKLDLPKITVPDMTGEITDLHTFFVAISPRLGIEHLHQQGDQYVSPKPVIGDFSNGRDILKGNDCLSVTLQLKQGSEKEAELQTDFVPPATTCLTYLLDEMRTPVVAGIPNNFQMVRPAGAEHFNLFYGKENFTIISSLSRSNGRLVRASMNNLLTLQLKLNCDSSYANCAQTFPFHIKRTLYLELLP